MLLLTPDKLPISEKLKIALGCISTKLVTNRNEIVKVRSLPLCQHDLYHLEVAQLERIQIGKYLVSGIHGINSPILHETPIIEEYDGILDEVRVAFHEFIVKTSIYNTVKIIVWMGWLILCRINPVAVFIRHYISLAKTQSANNHFAFPFKYEEKAIAFLIDDRL